MVSVQEMLADQSTWLVKKTQRSDSIRRVSTSSSSGSSGKWKFAKEQLMRCGTIDFCPLPFAE